MATKSSNIEIEKAQFNHIRQYVKAYAGIPSVSLDLLVELGHIQVSTAFEQAIADVGGYNVVSEDGRDFDDARNSDAKYSTVRTRDHHSAYSANISSLQNKIGALRVCVYDRIMERFYYFHIPKSAYGNASSIEIPFDQSGSPNRTTMSKRGTNWWAYEELTFTDMAQYMDDPVTRRRAANIRALESMTATIRTGGKVPGVLSMTKNAIRKREARARAQMGLQG